MRVSALTALTIISALVVLATWPQAAHLGTAVTDFGDPLLNATGPPGAVAFTVKFV